MQGNRTSDRGPEALPAGQVGQICPSPSLFSTCTHTSKVKGAG